VWQNPAGQPGQRTSFYDVGKLILFFLNIFQISQTINTLIGHTSLVQNTMFSSECVVVQHHILWLNMIITNGCWLLWLFEKMHAFQQVICLLHLTGETSSCFFSQNHMFQPACEGKKHVFLPAVGMQETHFDEKTC